MSTVNEKMTAIADQVRQLSGATSALGLDAMAQTIQTENELFDTNLQQQNELVSNIITALDNKVISSTQAYEEGKKAQYDLMSYNDTLTAINESLQNILDIIDTLPEGGQTLKYVYDKDSVIQFELSSSISTSDIEYDIYTENFELLNKDQNLLVDTTYYIITDNQILDLRSKGLKNLNIIQGINLNKIICFDNELTSLDLSNCPNLQYLHMFNNPICDNNEYLDNLANCINSLPNRKDKACGSIIYAPWYGLPILCTTTTQWLGNTIPNPFNGAIGSRDLIYRYPNREDYGTVNLIKNQIYGNIPMPEYDEVKSVTVQGRAAMERTTFIEGNIRYARYNGSNFTRDTETIALERHQNLRKALELGHQNFTCITDTSKTKWPMPEQKFIINAQFDGTLLKNWLFGSAIQYEENEWQNYCSNSFKIQHAADCWETAEFGFGHRYGLIDLYHKDINLTTQHQKRTIIDLTSPTVDGVTYTNTSVNSHANHMGIGLFGRGSSDEESYGLIPQAVHIACGYSDSMGIGIDRLMELCESYGATCYSFSLGKGENFVPGEEYKEKLDALCKEQFVCSAAGNSGIDGPWTMMKPLNYTTVSPMAYQVTMLSPTKERFGPSSSVKPHRDTWVIPGHGVSYIKGVFTVSNGAPVNSEAIITGTSYASPLTTGYLCLLKNIYDKIRPENIHEPYGYNSKFMNYVYDNWTTTLNVLDGVSNFGYLDIMSEPHKLDKFGATIDLDYNCMAKINNKIVPLTAQAYGKTYDIYHHDKFISKTTGIITNNEEIKIPSTLIQNGLTSIGETNAWTHQLYFNPQELKLGSPSTTYYSNYIIVDDENGLVKGESHSATKVKTYNPQIWKYGDATLYYRSLGENGTVYPNPYNSTEINAWNCLSDIGNNPQYSWLILQGIGVFVTLGSLKELHSNFDQPCVITVACTNSKEVTLYYNGTKVATGVAEVNKTFIPSATSTNANAIDSYFYNRILSDEEVLQNTIYLLNS